MAYDKSFQTNAEFKRLSKVKGTLNNRVLDFANKMHIKAVCNRLYSLIYYSKELGNDCVLNTFDPIWKVFYKPSKGALGYYVVKIADDDRGHETCSINFYLMPVGKNKNGYNTYTLVSEDEYIVAVNKQKLMGGDDAVSMNYKAAINECKQFVADITAQLKALTEWEALDAYVNDLVDKYRKSNLSQDVAFQKYDYAKKVGFTKIDFSELIDECIIPFRYTQKDIERFKSIVVNILMTIHHRQALDRVRNILLDNIDNIEKFIDSIKVDSSVDLSNDKFLIDAITNGKKTYEDIIKYAGKTISDPIVLEKTLLQMLKLYHDYKAINETNAKYLADFLIENDITDSVFESDIAKISTGIETLWPHIPSERRTKYVDNLPKDSQFRYVRTVRVLRERWSGVKNAEGKYDKLESTIDWNDDRVLDKMRAVMVKFNEPDHGALNTIIYSIDKGKEDDTYVFDFVTYKIGDNDPDGRRIAEFTAMFNRSSPNVGTVYFDHTKK